MGKNTSITCDNCEKELVVDSSYPHKFSLNLKVVDTGVNTSGAEFAVSMKPPLRTDTWFCNKRCLKQFLGT